MGRKRRKEKRRGGALVPTEVEWRFMWDAPQPDSFELLVLEGTLDPGHAPRPGRPHMRELWRAHRGTILPRWISSAPGTRPSLWWLYDAPRGDDGQVDPRQEAGARCPRSCAPRDGRRPRCRSCDPADPARFESVPAYLKRHRLLSAGERAKLAPVAFEPVSVEVLEVSRRGRGTVDETP